MFFLIMMKVKNGIVVLITQKLNVSHHVVFLKLIHFFSIPSITHNLTRSDLICIDLFYKDSDSLSSQVPIISNLPPQVTQPIHTNHSIDTDTLLSSTPEAPFSSIVPQAPFEIVNPPLSQSIHTRKSIKLQDFVYSCYSSSFTSFLAFIYCLSKLSSYKEAIFYLIW